MIDAGTMTESCTAATCPKPISRPSPTIAAIRAASVA
jgi:hypothetical protein